MHPIRLALRPSMLCSRGDRSPLAGSASRVHGQPWTHRLRRRETVNGTLCLSFARHLLPTFHASAYGPGRDARKVERCCPVHRTVRWSFPCARGDGGVIRCGQLEAPAGRRLRSRHVGARDAAPAPQTVAPSRSRSVRSSQRRSRGHALLPGTADQRAERPVRLPCSGDDRPARLGTVGGRGLQYRSVHRLCRLNQPRFEAHFTPPVEVGWRLDRRYWGHGYPTEAAAASLTRGFDQLGRDEIVSFTAAVNDQSRRVMQRLGMRHDSADDFDHPAYARPECQARRSRAHRIPRRT